MTTKFLRLFAGLWIVIGSLGFLMTLVVTLVVLAGDSRPNDGSGEMFAYSAAVAMASWTAGLTMSWMANISDDMRSAASR